MSLEKNGKYYKDTIAMANAFCEFNRGNVNMIRSRAHSLVRYSTEEDYDEFNDLFSALDNLLYDIDVLKERLAGME